MDTLLHVGALGPLKVWREDRSVTPTAVKPKTLLAMLAMSPNEVVPVTSLAAELWGDRAPRSAKTVIQTYVLSVRKLIAQALPADSNTAMAMAKKILSTTQDGYMLNVPQDHIDVRRFERLVDAGHRARERGDYQAASKNFAEALDCWNGRALADVRLGPNLRLGVTRLEEARLNVVDCRIDADLRLGRHHELLGELAALVTQHRTHEGFAAHYMLALYRSGRRSEALEVYQRLHASLVREKGLEPSPPLRRLQRSMLVSDRSLSDSSDGWRTTESGRSPAERTRSRVGTGPQPISAELASAPWHVAGGGETFTRDLTSRWTAG